MRCFWKRSMWSSWSDGTEILTRSFPPLSNASSGLVRDDNSSLIWILPYPTAELRNNMENFETYYDEIEICGSAASSHPKGAFQIRNRQMVKRSNLVVFYVDHTGGGAYQTMRYAQKEKKNILNLAGEGYGEKE